MKMKKCGWCNKSIPGTKDRPWEPGDSTKILHDDCYNEYLKIAELREKDYPAYQKWVKNKRR